MPVIPKYRSIYMQLKQSVRDGVYRPGDLLPTEKELCRTYEVSRTTIRKAMEMLEQEGYVRIRQGFGTQACDPLTSQQLGNISSITETLRARGFHVRVASVTVRKVPCPLQLAREYGLAQEEGLFQVERILLADEMPVAYIMNQINPELAPGMEQFPERTCGLYEFLEKEYHLQLTDAEECITAITADFVDSNLLHIPVGAPLIQSFRKTWQDDTLVGVSHSKLVAERYEYKIRLKGRQKTYDYTRERN